MPADPRRHLGRHLARAEELALRGRLRVEPNPIVGCVIVKGSRVIAEGYHARFGGPHAEVVALRKAKSAAKNASVYVTLEPCGHTGKTPPCAGALIRAGVREVVYALADPNPLTAGRGPALLRDAGIKVTRVSPTKSLRAAMEPYLERVNRKRPWVIAKWGMSLDGKIATRTDHSKWITGEVARDWAHKNLRARVDAILVGANTVRSDDPALTNRSGTGGALLRVVVAGERALPKRAQLLHDGGPTLVVLPDERRVPGSAETLVCGDRDGVRVNLPRLLRHLHERGVCRLLIEGGGQILGAFFDRKLVDQVAVFTAPIVLGGRDARVAVAGRGLARVPEIPQMSYTTTRRLGADTLIEGLLA